MRQISSSYLQRYVWCTLPVNLLLLPLIWFALDYVNPLILFFLALLFNMLYWLRDSLGFRRRKLKQVLVENGRVFIDEKVIKPYQIVSIQEVHHLGFQQNFKILELIYSVDGQQELVEVLPRPKFFWAKDKTPSPSVTRLIDAFPYLKHRVKRRKESWS